MIVHNNFLLKALLGVILSETLFYFDFFVFLYSHGSGGLILISLVIGITLQLLAKSKPLGYYYYFLFFLIFFNLLKFNYGVAWQDGGHVLNLIMISPNILNTGAINLGINKLIYTNLIAVPLSIFISACSLLIASGLSRLIKRFKQLQFVCK